MKGRAAILKEYQKPLEIQEYDVPDPEPGAVITRITQAGLCGSDLHTWRGEYGYDLPAAGVPLGHEGVGAVHSLGKGVATDFMGATLKEGDRIIFGLGYPCYRCIYCLSGDHNRCADFKLTYKPEAGEYPYFVSTYSDYLYLPPLHPVFKVPDELSDELVVSLNCALGTVFQGLKSAGLEQGQTVVTQGAGGLGLYTIALAKDMGAGRIIAIDGQKARLDLARELGADATIDINELKMPEERIAKVWELTGGRGADVVMELVGFSDLLLEGVEMLGQWGTYVEIGNFTSHTTNFKPSSVIGKARRIIGTTAYRPSYVPVMLDFLRRNHNTLPLHKIISHKFSLADIGKAFDQSEWIASDIPVIRSAIVP